MITCCAAVRQSLSSSIIIRCWGMPSAHGAGLTSACAASAVELCPLTDSAETLQAWAAGRLGVGRAQLDMGGRRHGGGKRRWSICARPT